MYSDPQSLTVNAVAKSLPRISSANPVKQGVYATSDGEFTFTTKQDQTANRFRREVRFTQKKIATDPISSVNKEISSSVIIAVDEPKWGFTDVELGHLVTALTSWLTAANRDKLLGGEL